MKMDLMKKKKKKGFTLIELIVVIAIIGILAAIAVPRFSGFQGSANLKSAKMTMKTIQTAVEAVAAEQSTTVALVGSTSANLDKVASLLGWTINATGVVTVDPVSPKGAEYTISITTGIISITVVSSTPWPTGTNRTLNWNEIKDL
jgi:type IV pilus assembly protein PilA